MKNGASQRLRLQNTTNEATRSDPTTPNVLGLGLHSVRRLWTRVPFAKVGLFVMSIFLFVLAIMLMKEGAHLLAPFVRTTFSVDTPANGLGFGWLFAYVVMSGSPVAAAALAFLDAGAIDDFTCFTMITGSRIGASFLVLLLGFVYVARGRDRSSSLGMGILSLAVTGSTHMIGLGVGILILQTGRLDRIQFQMGTTLASVINGIFVPIVDWFASFLPTWSLFAVGIMIVIISFSLFDRCLPEMAIKDSQIGHISFLVYRPWVMLLLGAGVTLISMSVSISLGILVPLSNRGFVRRENVIPYIMGANITTFIDTLLAAILLDNQVAFNVVLAEILSMALVSSLILALIYHQFEHGMLRMVSWTTASNRNLSIFIAMLLIAPVMLLFLF